MLPFYTQDTAAGLVAEVWRRNLLDETEASPNPGRTEIPALELAVRVAALAPKMSAGERSLFIKAFAAVWPNIDSSGKPNYGQNDTFVPSAHDETVLMKWISLIASRRKPVAVATKRRIVEGEKLAYPREYEAMKLCPAEFGIQMVSDSRIRYVPRLRLTHRQLALHVEFAPLLAAVFLASRLPGSLFGHYPISGFGSRPQVMSLLEVLLARRPDNMTDEQFVPYVRWLVGFRYPLWPDFGDCIIG